MLRAWLVLLAGPPPAPRREDEMAAARRHLEAAMGALRAARAAWTAAPEDPALGRVLEEAERELEAARARLERAAARA